MCYSLQDPKILEQEDLSGLRESENPQHIMAGNKITNIEPLHNISIYYLPLLTLPAALTFLGYGLTDMTIGTYLPIIPFVIFTMPSIISTIKRIQNPRETSAQEVDYSLTLTGAYLAGSAISLIRGILALLQNLPK